MKRVLCETTSVKLFPSVDEAQVVLTWIRDNLHKGVDVDPIPAKIVEVEGGFRYIIYSELDVPIPAEAYDQRLADNSLPMVFDNQRIVLIDV